MPSSLGWLKRPWTSATTAEVVDGDEDITTGGGGGFLLGVKHRADIESLGDEKRRLARVEVVAERARTASLKLRGEADGSAS
jgi:hypothetical protein